VHDKPIITVYNKADLIDLPALSTAAGTAILISTENGQGMDNSKALLYYKMADERQNCELLIPHDRYDVMSEVHEAGCVRETDGAREGR